MTNTLFGYEVPPCAHGRNKATCPFCKITPSFVHHSQTSMDAAHSIKAGTLRMKVLALIQEYPFGITDEMIARLLEMNPSTARPRRIELAQQGLIEVCGTAPTASKRRANLWRADRK